MNMHEIKEPREDLQDQLKTAKEEIQSLTQQLSYLFNITKKAWRGDEEAIIHLAELIGIDPEFEQNAFSKKKTIAPSSAKKTVKIVDNDEILSKHTTSISNLTNQENRREQEQQVHVQAAARDAYLQPFFKQNHIDPIREQNSKRVFNNVMRYHHTEMRKPPVIANRTPSATGRPRITKHLYQLASPDHIVRHLGSPSSRTKPYFVFAGKEFFQQTTNCAPLHEKGFITSNGSRPSEQADMSDESEIVASPRAEPVITRPQTAKSTHHSLKLRSGARSKNSDSPVRVSSAASNGFSIQVTQLNERERRDTMRLQRQLNLPRQGWVNQHS